jgi:hypothetical protein
MPLSSNALICDFGSLKKTGDVVHSHVKVHVDMEQTHRSDCTLFSQEHSIALRRQVTEARHSMQIISWVE